MLFDTPVCIALLVCMVAAYWCLRQRGKQNVLLLIGSWFILTRVAHLRKGAVKQAIAGGRRPAIRMATPVLARSVSAIKNRLRIAAHCPSVIMQFAKPLGDWDYSAFAAPVAHDGGMTLYRIIYGDFWGQPGIAGSIGNVVMEQICGIYEHGAVRVRPGDVVIDLGAHLGVFVRRALDAGASRVIAFEANADNAKYLWRTFREDISAGRVALVEAAAWNCETTLRFGGTGMCGIVSDDGQVEIHAETIDGVAANLGLPRVDFIKTDIEGAEREALTGASGTLRRCAPRMAVSSYHLPDDPEVLASRVIDAQPAYRLAFDHGQKRMFCWR